MQKSKILIIKRATKKRIKKKKEKKKRERIVHSFIF